MTANVSNITSGFIDIATFDELEKFMYGGGNAITYFVREVRKSTWFTQIPVPLSRINGFGTFGSECMFNVSRSGDYLLQAARGADRGHRGKGFKQGCAFY